MAKFLSEEGLRYFYNQIKSKFAAASHNHSAGNITSGTLPIARGGTGATTLTDAQTNLGIDECLNIGLLDNLTQIPKNADLNNYITAGTYACGSGDIANTLKNAPVSIGGNCRLVVMKAFNGFLTQIIFTTNWRGHWTRTCYLNNGEFIWQDWVNMTAVKNCLINNNGYIIFGGISQGLIFAWARYSGGASSSDVIVTKPYSGGFTTLIAQATDSGSGGREAQRWNAGTTTKTTDTFAANGASDAFTVFWVGKV